jgi:sensor histidine kinase YesM
MGIVKPIKKINRLFKKINLDNINEGMQETVFIDEISELGSTFNTMLSRIEDLFDDVMAVNAEKLKIEGEKREAEIAALQSQINPHFFYNTLDAVKYLIKSGFSKRAIGMVDNLSDLFRYGIGRDELIIGIKEEIEYARIYSDIMSLRYGDKLKFIWEIDEKAYAYQTIKLILQPIIENAIHHGVKDNIDEGVIRITCKCLESGIRFIIEDNGIGMGPERLQELRLNIHKRKERRRIGLYNIQTRLKLYYGESGKLLISSVKNKGTEVTIELPYDNSIKVMS